MDRVLNGGLRSFEAPALLDPFLAEPSLERAPRFGPAARPPILSLKAKDRLLARLARHARLDALLSAQVNAILHHPQFQRLEASWRGLYFLAEQADGAEGVKVRVLSASWKQLARDLDRAIEFDQSQLFTKVYSDEFGTPGGEPFGVLLGDYECLPSALGGASGERHRGPAEDFRRGGGGLRPLRGSRIRPCLDLTASPSGPPAEPRRAFDQMEYFHWNDLGQGERVLLGVTMPRVLMRLPYEDDGARADGFRFARNSPRRTRIPVGHGGLRLRPVLVQTFAKSGWLAEIRGVKTGEAAGGAGGGVVNGLPVHSFSTDKQGVVPKCSTDAMITDYQEQDLSELGFLPLCHCQGTELSSVLHEPVDPEGEEVRHARRDDERPHFSDAAIHLMRIAVRPLFEGHGPRQDRLVPGGRRVRGVSAQLAAAVRHVRRGGFAGDKGPLPLRKARVKVKTVRGPAAISAPRCSPLASFPTRRADGGDPAADRGCGR